MALLFKLTAMASKFRNYRYKTDSSCNLRWRQPITDFQNSTGRCSNQFEVFQNYPNPSNPVTEIRYQLPERSTVEIAIYNALGQKSKTLLSQTQEMEAIEFK
ncbi:MAG: hypothetical protein R3C26_00920 [Calditrichia bacterium]